MKANEIFEQKAGKNMTVGEAIETMALSLDLLDGDSQMSIAYNIESIADSLIEMVGILKEINARLQHKN